MKISEVIVEDTNSLHSILPHYLKKIQHCPKKSEKMRRGRDEEEEEEHHGPALMPVLHFCDDAQRTTFATAMTTQEVISDETLEAQGLSDTPGEKEMRVVIYKLLPPSGKNVLTVTQLPRRGLHESMNTYTRMLHGQGLKVPHPMIPEFHEYLGRYLGMEISNDDAFLEQLYAQPPPQAAGVDDSDPWSRATSSGLRGDDLFAPYLGQRQERPAAPPLRQRRRVGGAVHRPPPPPPAPPQNLPPDFPFPPPLQMVRMVLSEFGYANVFFMDGGEEGGIDLSAPGRVEDKPKPLEVTPLGEEWEQLLGPPEKVDGVPDCPLCVEYSATITLVPCGHRLGCADCFRKLMTTSTLSKVCPECKNDFKTFVKVRN